MYLSDFRPSHDFKATRRLHGGFAGLGDTAVTPLMMAIANAEGFNVSGSIPQRANNPGDLVLGDIGYGTLGSGGITVFPSIDAGWAALANQINLIASGQSTAGYSPTMTIEQVGAIYSGDSTGNWANNVAAYLGVSSSAPFAAVAGGSPSIVAPAGAVPGISPSLPSSPTTMYLLAGGAALVLTIAALA